jgi:tRNA modification GTPase
MVFFMLDTSRPLEEEDRLIFGEIGDKPTLILLNKMDLPLAFSENEVQDTFPGLIFLPISAKTGEGIDTLKKKISALVNQTIYPETLPDLIPTLRQKIVFEQMIESLTRAAELSAQGESPEFIALDLQKALEDLGTLIGSTTTEDILDRVFSRFCIGK